MEPIGKRCCAIAEGYIPGVSSDAPLALLTTMAYAD